jgi:hypothetical protein
MGFCLQGMQVRATDIVAEAQIKGIEPPSPFPVQELRGEARNPLPGEMKAVFDFELLIKCVECMIFNWVVPQEPEGNAGHEGPLVLDKYSQWVRGGKNDKWKARLHRGLYHVLLAGAVCSGPYNAPFLRVEKEGRTEFLERCARCSPHPGRITPLTAEDLEYLRTFLVYDIPAGDNSEDEIRRNNEYKTIYGPLADYLIKEGAQDGLREQLERTKISEYDQQNVSGDRSAWYSGEETGSIREIKTLVASYEYFSRKVYRTDYSKVAIPFSSTTLPSFEGQRKVTAVIFGRFQLEEIFLPTIVQDAENGFLLARATSESLELGNVDVQQVLNQVLKSNRMSPDGYPRLPLSYQFFLFSLRTHFNLKWKPDIFDPESGRQRWREELRSGDMFQGPHMNPGKFNHADALVFDPDTA